jgi:hypothetical protein
MTMQLREGLLAFDHAGRPEHTPEPDTAVYRTSDNTFELVTEDGERLLFDRAEIHAATAPSMERARQRILNVEAQHRRRREQAPDLDA